MSASFEDLIGPLLEREGGYVDDPRDAGGETCWGVTRKVARAAGYDGEMRDMGRERAIAIYRDRYWTRPGLDRIARVNPCVAARLFDISVNMGAAAAVSFLQRALNILNRGGRDYPDVAVDGVAGPGLIRALGAFLRQRGPPGEAVLLAALTCLQGARYLELAEARPADEAFEFGWFANRILRPA